MTRDGLPGEGPWILSVPSNASVYHDDPECPHLAREDREPRAVAEATIEWHELGLCPDCADAGYRGSNPGVAPDVGGGSA